MVRCFSGYISLSTSRGVGNGGITSSATGRSTTYSYLSTSRGAENFTIVSTPMFPPFCISTYLHREGPETCTHKRGKPTRSCLYRYLSTSRGAGNLDSGSSPSALLQYISLSTSRGAGKSTYLPFMYSITSLSLYRYLSTSRGVGNSR